jgi:hypothetical protein
MAVFNLLGGRRRIAMDGSLLGKAALLGTAPEERVTRPVSSDDVEAALGEERIQWLMRQTGLTRSELVAGLRFSREVEIERFARYSLRVDSE